jgi:tripartite-type tricarboxylate transporter receptor subunit TctC
MMIFRFLLCVVLCGFASFAFSQGGWPSKLVKIVVPYPGGGEADFLARVLAQKMSENWGQPVIVDNRPGATGSIGTDYVAKSPADGYTLLMGSDIQFAISPAGGVKVPYDPDKDFEPVGIAVLANLILVAPPSLPANNLRDLTALSRAQPGKINFASTGNGSNDHLGLEMLKMRGGFDITHVPYKGQGAALPDLVGGQVQLALFGMASTLPHVKAGRLKALAVASSHRLAVLPNVPTIAESGFPGYEANISWCIYAPAGTPKDVIAKINADIIRVLKLSDVKERLEEAGQEPVGSTPQQVTIRMREQRAKWAKVILEAGIKLEQ